MAKIFVNEFFNQIAPAVNSPAIKRQALAQARGILEEHKDELINEFDNHPVTKELEAGPGEEDSVNGVVGNLYSFIGFRQGYDPTGVLRNILQKDIKLDARIPNYNRQIKGFLINVLIPSMSDIYEQTPFHEWDGGISWVRGIETYISGLHRYISIFEPRLSSKIIQKYVVPATRSGGGIESEKLTRLIKRPFKQYRARRYMSDLMRKFRARFRGPGGRFI